jgi:hypothetical protein
MDMILNRCAPVLGLALILSLFSVPASAHIGPPFPIIENQRVGPVVIALWTHPDIGQGLFYVIVDPAPGGTIPKDLKVKIGVQPESGRLPEAFYKADRDDTRNQVQYRTYADFDRDEFWRVHLVIESAEGNGEAFSRVEATPTFMGRFGLVFFSLPFVAVGYLWYRGMSKKKEQMRKRRATRQAKEAADQAIDVGRERGANSL